MQGGYNYSQRAYYIKNDVSLWTRCRLDEMTGFIHLSCQYKLERGPTSIAVIGPGGEEVETIKLRPGMPLPPVGWNDLATITVDHADWVTDAVKSRNRYDIVEAVCTHAIFLYEKGLSADAALLPFQEISGYGYLHSGEYLITGDHAMFQGLKGHFILIDEVAQSIAGRIQVGREEFSVDFPLELSLDFILNTVPNLE